MGGLTERSVTEMTPVFQKCSPSDAAGSCTGTRIPHCDYGLRFASCFPKILATQPVKRHASWNNWLVSEMHWKSRTAKLLIECTLFPFWAQMDLVRKHSEDSFSIIRHVTRPTENHQATSMKKNETEYWIRYNLNLSNSVSAYAFTRA